jgi:hypothetical protein
MAGHISGGAINCGIKAWFAKHTTIAGAFANTFVVSLMILVIIWTLDFIYAKDFACAKLREYIQHATVGFVIVVLGIFLNNSAIHALHNKDELVKVCGASEPSPSYEPSSVKSYDLLNLDDGSLAVDDSLTVESADDLISQYVA